MALYQRDDSDHWWYDFTLKGRRFRGSTQTACREDAQVVEAKLRHDALMGAILGQRASLTLDEAFGWYYKSHAAHLPYGPTLLYMGTTLSRIIGKDRSLRDISTPIVARYIAKRRGEMRRGSFPGEDPEARVRRPMSTASINREVSALRAVMNRAARHLEIEVGKVDWKALKLREADIRVRYLSNEEARRLLNASADHLRPIIEFALLTGCRAGNILTLDWSQIDLQHQVIQMKIKSKKQGGKNHTIPAPAELVKLLRRLGPEESGPVFTLKGEPVKSVKKAFAAACRRAGVPNFRFHDLRHTAASWMVQSGVPLQVVKEILGHEVITTTMRYAHMDTAAKSQAMDALASRMRHAGNATANKSLLRKVK